MKDLRKEIKLPKKVKAKDPIKQILDDKDLDNVVLYDVQGQPIEFEQVARIELDEYDEIFVILIPVTKVKDVEEGEGVVYCINAEQGTLDVVDDQSVIDKVLEAYMKLIGE